MVALDTTRVADAANVEHFAARAKLSLRLGVGDDPRAAMDALNSHLRSHAEFGAQVTITEGSWPRRASSTPTTQGDAARDAFTEAFGQAPVEIGLGGSIPFIAEFATAFPDAAILVTGVEDRTTRSRRRRSLHLGQFAKVCLAETLLLDRLANRR